MAGTRTGNNHFPNATEASDNQGEDHQVSNGELKSDLLPYTGMVCRIIRTRKQRTISNTAATVRVYHGEKHQDGRSCN